MSNDYRKFEGPILVTAEAIADLAQLVEENTERLAERRALEIDRHEERQEQPSLAEQFQYRLTTEIKARWQDRTRHRWKTLAEFISDPAVRRRVLKELEVRIGYGSSHVELTIEPGDARVGTYGEDNDIQSLGNHLEGWVEEAQASPFERFARRVNPMHWIVAIFVVIGTLSVYFQTSASLWDEADVLVQGGITEAEMAPALELILKKEYSLSNKAFPLPTWLWMVAGAVFWTCLCMSLVPRSIIGVGKGKRALARYRLTKKVATVTVPALFLSILVEIVF